MVLSDENTRPSLAKPTHMQGGGAEMGSRKFGGEVRPNRRALGSINQNFIGGHPYPRVVNKANQVCEKKPLIPAHRPITRKFAAQIASKKQHNKGESKRSNPAAAAAAEDEGFTIWEDCEIADVEEQKPSASDQPVPMALESEPEEKDQMEVEMEDIFDDEPVINIDGRDSANALAVVEYVDDLYAYYRKMENCSCVSPNYMSRQGDINEKMRAILIDWLVEVHHKFDLRDETLFLTVNIIDRFLAQEGVVRKKLQLVGLVAMLLACKYEEVSVPVVDDLVFISDKAYSRKEILEMERLMLNKLQFNMSVPTPYVFIKRFLKAAQADKKLELLSFFLMELCLVEYEMLKFSPSFLAAAAIYTAQCTLYGFKQWNKTCQWYSSYSEAQLQECSKMIVSYHQKAATGRLTGVHRKYSTSKFGFAAKCEPAHFVMDESQK